MTESGGRTTNGTSATRRTAIRCVGTALYFIPVRTRVPLKFGPETLTSVTCARVRLRARDSGVHLPGHRLAGRSPARAHAASLSSSAPSHATARTVGRA